VSSENFPGNSSPAQGFYIPTAAQAFYGQVHISAGPLDAFKLTYKSALTFSIWNSNNSTLTIASINSIGATPLSLSADPARSSTTFTQMESKTFFVTLTDKTQKTLDATYQFSFVETMQTVSIRIVGTWVDVLVIPPDRETPLTEGIEYKTNVLTNYNGSEQVIRLRGIPRYTLSYTLLLTGPQLPRFRNLLAGLTGLRVGVPDWALSFQLSQPVALGSSILVVSNTFPKQFIPGDLLILFESTSKYQIVEVKSCTGSGYVGYTLTLTTSSNYNWNIGSTFYRFGVARMQLTNSLTQLSADTAKTSVSLIYDAYQSDAIGGDVPYSFIAPSSYQPNTSLVAYFSNLGLVGNDFYIAARYWVLEDILNWSGDITATFDQKRTRLDNQTSNFRWEIEGHTAVRAQTFRLFLNSPLKLGVFKQWLAIQKGMCGVFWVPSGSRDMEVVSDIPMYGNTIVIKKTRYATLVAQGRGYQDIRIQLTTGEVFYRRITLSAAINSTTEQLTLDITGGVLGSIFNKAVPVSQIQLISFLFLARLSEDKVTITHYGPNFATAEFTVQGITGDQALASPWRVAYYFE